MLMKLTTCLLLIAVVGMWLYTCYLKKEMIDPSIAVLGLIGVLCSTEGIVKAADVYGKAKKEIPPGATKIPNQKTDNG